MANFFTINFWLNSRPGSLESNAQIAFLVFLFLLVACYAVTYVKLKNKSGSYTRILNSTQSLSLTNFIVGLFLLFFTYEQVPFLSSRVLFLVWFAEMAIWAYFIVSKFFDIPKIKEEKEKKKEFQKYIP